MRFTPAMNLCRHLDINGSSAGACALHEIPKCPCDEYEQVFSVDAHAIQSIASLTNSMLNELRHMNDRIARIEEQNEIRHTNDRIARLEDGWCRHGEDMEEIKCMCSKGSEK